MTAHWLSIAIGLAVFAGIVWACWSVALMEKPPYLEDQTPRPDEEIDSVKAALREDNDVAHAHLVKRRRIRAGGAVE